MCIPFVLVMHETSLNKILCHKIKQNYPHLNVVSELSGSGSRKWSRFTLAKEDVAMYGSTKDEYNIVCMEGELDAKAFEAKMTRADAAAPKARSQLKANMMKSGSMVGINAIRAGGIFTKITVIGLIVDYEQNLIVYIVKAVMDFTKSIIAISEATCSEVIDKMIARVDASFKT